MEKSKLNQFFALIFLIFLFSCTKSREKEIITEQLEIVENKTNIPIDYAQIKLYRCAEYGIIDCKRIENFATGYTDSHGKYTYKPDDYAIANEGRIARKNKYWDLSVGAGKAIMEPEAWIDLHLSRKNTYPDTSFFRFTSVGETGVGSLSTFRCPDDTMIRVRVVGNEINTFNWAVIFVAMPCVYFCPIDTFASGGFTQKLDKFGSISLDLSY